jgi:starch synthase
MVTWTWSCHAFTSSYGPHASAADAVDTTAHPPFAAAGPSCLPPNPTWLPHRYTNGGKDLKKYEEAKEHSKSVWVELSGGWHELKYFTLHKNGVDWVFIDHLSFQRPGTPYGNHAGPFNDNLFRFGLLSLGALEAPLNLPIKRDRWGQLSRRADGLGGCWTVSVYLCVTNA